MGTGDTALYNFSLKSFAFKSAGMCEADFCLSRSAQISRLKSKLDFRK
jgi:hypothetical protein